VKHLHEQALRYHRMGRPGKIAIAITKPAANQDDLTLAYSPGVAEPVREIQTNPADAYTYTAKGNLVAVVTNGTAVLGLGNVGALAAKPVMEGKALLFKRFADVDAYDLEVDTRNPDDLVEIVAALEPTFGGINLEDIAAPECFYIEEELRARMNIPVFHDDQHGTAIITGAALLNALDVAGKRLGDVRVVISGAGASAIATAAFFTRLGMPREHITLVDTKGVIYAGRVEGMNPYKARYAIRTPARTLADAMAGADVFIGLSAAGIVSPQMLHTMAPRPIVFALANPDPEIGYDEAVAARPDAIAATGRSDYPNQVNNVLGFPFIFRGALDVQAKTINDEMKVAASNALAALAREPVPDVVLDAYGLSSLSFGPGYLIPTPLDPRVPLWVAPAVAEAAMRTGVARAETDLTANKLQLAHRLQRTGGAMAEVSGRRSRRPRRRRAMAG
jgi:malate dehydrogenase (oxaloacetate-decarboxylating)(NADP+)